MYLKYFKNVLQNTYSKIPIWDLPNIFDESIKIPIGKIRWF